MSSITVGEVHIKVRPNTKGFRQEVERDLSNLRDVQLGVDPKTAGLRQKIERAAKGLRATVDVDADDTKLRNKLRNPPKPPKYSATVDAVISKSKLLKSWQDAAKDLKLAPIHQLVEMQFGRDNMAGSLGQLPGLKRDLIFIRDLTKHITLAGLGKPLERISRGAFLTKREFDAFGRSLRRIKVPQSLALMGNTLRGLGHVLRTTGSGFLTLGKTVKWATGGYAVDAKLHKFLDTTRNKAGAAGREIKFYGVYAREALKSAASGAKDKALDQARVGYQRLRETAHVTSAGIQADADERRKNALRNLKQEIDALKEYDQLYKALHPGKSKKKARESAPIRDEFKGINFDFKNLSKMSARDLEKELPNLIRRISEFRREMGASISDQEDFRRSIQGVQKDVKRASRMEKITIPGLSDTLKKLKTGARSKGIELLDAVSIQRAAGAIRMANTHLDRFKKSSDKGIDPVPNAALKKIRQLKDSFDASPAGAQLDKLKDNLSGIGSAIRRAGSGTKDFLGTKAIRKPVQAFGDLKDKLRAMSRDTERNTAAFQRLKGAMSSAGGVFKKLFPDKDTNRIKRAGRVVQHSSKKILGLSRFGWIAGAIGAIAAPLVQLVSGALAALPALGLAGAAVLGVVAIGFDGIKDAAGAAADGFYEMKNAVSDVFRERMTPQFEQLGDVLSAITPNAVNVANGFSDFTQGMVDAVSGAKGLSSIQKLMDNTGQLMSDLKPFAQSFTEGLLEMGATGSESFKGLAQGLNSFGQTFSNAVSEMSASGALKTAIDSTFEVLGSASMNLGRIIRAGIESAGEMVQPAKALFEGFADGVIGLLPMFSSFSAAIFNIAGELLSQLGSIGQALAPGFAVFSDAFGSVITNLSSKLGEALVSFAPIINEALVMLGTLTQIAGAALGAALDAVTRLGDALSNSGINIGPWLGLAAALAGAFAILGPVVGFVTSAFAGIAAVVSGVVGVFGAVAGAVGSFISVLYGLPGIIAGIIGSIGGFISGIMGAISSITAAVSAAGGVWAMLSASISLPGVGIVIAAIAAIVGGISLLVAKVRDGSVSFDGFKAKLAEIGAAVLPVVQGAFQALQGALSTIGSKLAEFGASILPQCQAMFTALGSALQTVWAFISPLIPPIMTLAQALGGILLTALKAVWNVLTTLVSAFISVVTAVFQFIGSLEPIAGVLGNIIGAVANFVASFIGGFAQIIAGAIAFGVELVAGIVAAGAQFVAAVISFIASAISAVSGLPDQAKAALAHAGSALVASGKALIQGFINGIKSMISAVTDAVSSVVSAARNFFPFSPAKKGPFSGKGYTTWSGRALVKDFAKGMLDMKGTAESAAASVAGAAQRQFAGAVANPEKEMRNFQRNKILQPVLEHNAEQIARYREKNEEAEKQHAERLAEISKQTAEQQGKAADSVSKLKGKNVNKAEKLAKRNASISESEAKKIAKADENLAKKLAKNREELEKNLETPDYSDIDLSFNKYWVEGTKEYLKEKIGNIVQESNLPGMIKNAANDAVKEGRKHFGNHPIFAQVEANVNAKHFSATVERVFEEAGLNEVPVNFVVDNLNQLKDDLNMGDGVVSRAIDLGLDYNMNNSDAKRYRDEQAKTEVHYHVEDMQEAIRLEQLRERKKMMKVR